MKHIGSLASVKVCVLATMGLWSACGGDSGGNKDKTSDDCPNPATSAPTSACGNPGATAPLCSTQVPAGPVADISGTWVLETIGAQVVQVPGFPQPFHIKSINTALVQVAQTGNAVTVDGPVCNRIQHDDPQNPAQVIMSEAWRLTPSLLHKSGTFADDGTGKSVLTLPAVVDEFGAHLTDLACDKLPIDANDPRLTDDDHDGFPGITLGLQGLINGSLRAVQRQVTALTGLALTAERIEGGMIYNSDQTVVSSVPSNIACLYRSSTSYPDPAACSSSFVMVKVSPSAGAVDCAWVRDNQKTLLGL